MPRPLVIFTVVGLSAAFACGDSKEGTEARVLATDETDPPTAVLGVSALEFRCESIVPDEMASGIIGVEVERRQSQFNPPAGVPDPCHYRSRGVTPVEYSFDIDCRSTALDDGAKLMSHYATAAGAEPIAIGQSGLDHSNAAILFIDDDTPCYGRILGPDKAIRLKLAQTVAERLTEKRAPTGYRYQSAP